MKHQIVKGAEDKVKSVRQEAIEAVRAHQEVCPHSKVVTDGDVWGGRRICVECGVEELIKHGFSWETADGGFYTFMRPAGLKPLLDVEFSKHGDVVPYRVRV